MCIHVTLYFAIYTCMRLEHLMIVFITYAMITYICKFDFTAPDLQWGSTWLQTFCIYQLFCIYWITVVFSRRRWAYFIGCSWLSAMIWSCTNGTTNSSKPDQMKQFNSNLTVMISRSGFEPTTGCFHLATIWTFPKMTLTEHSSNQIFIQTLYKRYKENLYQ